MTYQSSNPQINTGSPAVATSDGGAPISQWWPIGLLISSVLFFILGGGLLGAWSSSTVCDYGYFDDICYGNASEYDGGIACIVIAVVLKVAFWIVLIVFCVQRRRSRASPSTVVYVNAQAAAESGNAAKAQPQASMYSTPQPEFTGVQPAPQYGAPAQVQTPVAEKQAVTRYCGHCGAGNVTPFCAQCGSQVPM